MSKSSKAKRKRQPQFNESANAHPDSSAVMAGKTATRPDAGGVLVFLAIIVLFFSSGFSSLIYQVVWTRTLGLIFGATTFATATVLAIFMGGLALGSWVAGRYADRVKHPLVVYGILEGAIAVWALMTPMMFSAAVPFYKWVWLNTHASVIPFSLLRFACTALILLVPTACMGATLPILSKFIGRSLENIGNRIGTLYASNTLGAIAGAVFAGFMLLPSIGLASTTLVAATINFVLLVAVLILNQFQAKADSADALTTASVEPSANLGEKRSLSVTAVMVAFGISGAIAMTYEVCWTRALLMVIGSSTYAFTLMLTAFLTGIFIGSIICAKLVDKTDKPMLWFAGLQLALGLLTVVSLLQFNQVPFWNLYINAHVHLEQDAVMFLRFLLAGSVLVPTTVCLGGIFPVVVKVATTKIATVGKSVGSLYACNTVGAIAGAFLAGFVLIPLFGTEKTLTLCASGNTLLALLLLYACSKESAISQRLLRSAGACGVLLLGFLCFTPGLWDRGVILMAQTARRNLPHRGFEYKSYDDWRSALRADTEVRFWADGPCSNVGVVYYPESKITSLITNGHIDASDDADLPVQALLSGLPLLVKPNTQDVAVVGWGSGQTIGTATTFPGIKSIDAIELEPNVIPASKFFHHVNHSPENDPRVHTILNDGRNYLLATDKKFDLIVSEPSNPWQSGVCNLFTKEYFEICKSRLRPNGCLSLWLQIAEVPPDDLCGVIAALNQTFPHTLAFYPRPGNTIILASAEPITMDLPMIEKLLKDKQIGAEFKSVGIADVGSFLAHIAASSDGLRGLISSKLLNTDDTNHLEFDVGKSYEDKTFQKQNRRLLSTLSGSPWEQVKCGNWDAAAKAQVFASASQQAVGLGGRRLAMGWLDQSIRMAPTVLGLKLSAASYSKAGNFKAAVEQLNKAAQLDSQDGELLAMRGSLLVSLGDHAHGMADLTAAMSTLKGKRIAEYFFQKAGNRMAATSSGM